MDTGESRKAMKQGFVYNEKTDPLFVYLMMDMISFAASIAVMWKMDVEKFAK